MWANYAAFKSLPQDPLKIECVAHPSQEGLDNAILYPSLSFSGIAEDSAFLSTLRSSHFDVAVHEVYEMSSVAIFEVKYLQWFLTCLNVLFCGTYYIFS